MTLCSLAVPEILGINACNTAGRMLLKDDAIYESDTQKGS